MKSVFWRCCTLALALCAMGCGPSSVTVTGGGHDDTLGDTTFVDNPIPGEAGQVPNRLGDVLCTNMTEADVGVFGTAATPDTPPPLNRTDGPSNGQFLLSWTLCNSGRVDAAPGTTYPMKFDLVTTDKTKPINPNGTPPNPSRALSTTEDITQPALKACTCFVQAAAVQATGGTITIPPSLPAQANLAGLDFEFPTVTLTPQPDSGDLLFQYEASVPGTQAFPFKLPSL